MAQFFLSLAALAILIVGLTHVSAWISEIQNKKEHNKHRYRNTQNRRRNSDKTSINTIAADIHSIRNELASSNKEQDRHQGIRDLFEKIGIVAAIMTAVAAIVSTWIFQGQLREMQDSDRAWVSAPDIRIINSAVHDKSGLQFTMFLTFKNSGHSPARHTFFAWHVYFQGGVEKILETDVCGEAEKSSLVVTVFPGEPLGQGVGSHISETDLASTEAMPTRQQDTIIPMILACIAYQDSRSNEFHHTPYVFVLTSKDMIASPTSLLMVNPSVTSTSDLGMISMPLGNVGPAD